MDFAGGIFDLLSDNTKLFDTENSIVHICQATHLSRV